MSLMLSAEHWQTDIEYLAAVLPQRHINLFHTTAETDFHSALAKLRDTVSHLTSEQIVAELARIVNSVGDGHTFLQLPITFTTFPVEFMGFENDFRLVSSDPASQTALGMRLVAIDEKPLAAVLDVLESWVNRGESSTYVQLGRARLLSQATLLHAIGIVRNAGHAQFTFADDDGSQHDIVIAAGEVERRVYVYGERVPIFRQQPDEAVWFTRLDADTFYINFSRYPNWEEMLAFAYYVIEQLAQSTSSLIIDLRRNGGGNFAIGDYGFIRLLSVSRNMPEKIFTLIGRETFSAGMVNAIHSRDLLGAHLLGEQTGARPNHYQENRWLTLPNSALSVSYSTQYYRFQEQDTDGVQPDTFLNLEWDAFKAGRDNLIEWCLAQT